MKGYFDKLPYKKNYVLAAFIIWNLLFIPLIIELSQNYSNPDIGLKFLPPFIFAFLTCLIIILFKSARRKILKNGKTFNDIRKDAFLFLAISTAMLFLQLYSLKAN